MPPDTEEDRTNDADEREARKKEREREASRRSRARKREEFQRLQAEHARLQEECAELRRENAQLRVELQRERTRPQPAAVGPPTQPPPSSSHEAAVAPLPPAGQAPLACASERIRSADAALRGGLSSLFGLFKRGVPTEELGRELQVYWNLDLEFSRALLAWAEDAAEAMRCAEDRLAHSWIISSLVQAEREASGTPGLFLRHSPEARLLATEASASLALDPARKADVMEQLTRNYRVFESEQELFSSLHRLSRELSGVSSVLKRMFAPIMRFYEDLVTLVEPEQFVRYLFWFYGDSECPGRGKVVSEYVLAEKSGAVPAEVIARVLAGPGPVLARLALAPMTGMQMSPISSLASLYPSDERRGGKRPRPVGTPLTIEKMPSPLPAAPPLPSDEAPAIPFPFDMSPLESNLHLVDDPENVADAYPSHARRRQPAGPPARS
eukprot:tig00021070_g17827.t1